MNVFVLTGAGVSAESGLGTFRDPGGLWEKYDWRELATPEAFARDPQTVHAFYDLRRRHAAAASPNAAHQALARLDHVLTERGDALFLCTQIVDDLHERAGSPAVLHMHGELSRARCLACGHACAWRDDLGLTAACPHCACVGRMRPDVVWFGEVPRGLDAIEEALAAATLFVAIGTSGAVYPAAGFVAAARARGLRTCEINLQPADNAALFDEQRIGPATDAVPRWVEHLMSHA